ncbi:MAG: Uma2 family endonuclease [Planctomycetaceae bacterium]|nr:Uma2 family endonuclease [Planctomycetaceae bacterium]
MTTLIEKIATGEAPPFVPLTVEQYVQMAEVGILPTTPRVELLDGLLVLKDRRDAEGDIMTEGPRHGLIGRRLFKYLDTQAEQVGCHARFQQPMAIPPYHAPEPDVFVVRGPDTDYAERLPGPADTVAAIEVSWSSLRTDRSTKLERYAAAGIPIYWIVDLVNERIEVYSDPIPAESRYGVRTVFDWKAALSLPLPGGGTIHVPLAEIFP